MESNIQKIRKITIAGLILNVALTSMKAVGGYLFHSQSLIADAVHSLSDLTTDLIVLFGVKYWSAPPDESHPYGYGRIETIVSALIGLILAGVAVDLACEAVKAVFSGAATKPEFPAFWIALFSIISKEILCRKTMDVSVECSSSALKANAMHHRSDAASSIPVALALLAAYIFPQMKYADQLGAVLVSMFILHSAWQIVKPSFDELSDAGDRTLQEKIRRTALSHPQIRSVHLVRTRKTGNHITGDMHIFVSPEITVSEGHKIAHRLKLEIISEDGGTADITIYVEPDEPE